LGQSQIVSNVVPSRLARYWLAVGSASRFRATLGVRYFLPPVYKPEMALGYRIVLIAAGSGTGISVECRTDIHEVVLWTHRYGSRVCNRRAFSPAEMFFTFESSCQESRTAQNLHSKLEAGDFFETILI
jgi:hypothetical protein